MGDVDSLLEELDLSLGKKKPASVSSGSPASMQGLPAARVADTEIENLLAEIDTKHETLYPRQSPFTSPCTMIREGNNIGTTESDASLTFTNGPKQRCSTIKIGGSKWPLGCAPTCAVDNRCSNIRCTKCDFKVVSFDDYAWSNAVTYLFLRNNVPDFTKLVPMLISAKGCCAYACQCSSKTANNSALETLGEQSDVQQWTCGGHFRR
jgi:hypothetical protein